MRRRLDKLEGALGPKEAVLRWMAQAHAHDSLPTYVATLVDQPEAAQPFIAVPRRVGDAVYASMRGQRNSLIEAATREAVGDTVFLLRLVIGINVHIDAVLQRERLRHAALYWWSRALDPERRSADPHPAEWSAAVDLLVGTLTGTERALLEAQARYLDGHEVRFPELASAWRALCLAAAALGGDGDDAAATLAAQDVHRIVRMARADGLDAAGRHAAADAMADRVMEHLGMVDDG